MLQQIEVLLHACKLGKAAAGSYRVGKNVKNPCAGYMSV
jgi:hypothetical protein